MVAALDQVAGPAVEQAVAPEQVAAVVVEQVAVREQVAAAAEQAHVVDKPAARLHVVALEPVGVDAVDRSPWVGRIRELVDGGPHDGLAPEAVDQAVDS